MKSLKFGLIGLLLGAAVAVGSATVGSEETAARACCSQCYPNYDECMEACTLDTWEACDQSCSTLCSRTCDASC